MQHDKQIVAHSFSIMKLNFWEIEEFYNHELITCHHTGQEWEQLKTKAIKAHDKGVFYHCLSVFESGLDHS